MPSAVAQQVPVNHASEVKTAAIEPMTAQPEPAVHSDPVKIVSAQVVKKIELGTMNTGNHPVELQVSDMKAGIYYIAVTVGQRKSTQKLLVQ